MRAYLLVLTIYSISQSLVGTISTVSSVPLVVAFMTCARPLATPLPARLPARRPAARPPPASHQPARQPAAESAGQLPFCPLADCVPAYRLMCDYILRELARLLLIISLREESGEGGREISHLHGS